MCSGSAEEWAQNVFASSFAQHRRAVHGLSKETYMAVLKNATHQDLRDSGNPVYNGLFEESYRSMKLANTQRFVFMHRL